MSRRSILIMISGLSLLFCLCFWLWSIAYDVTAAHGYKAKSKTKFDVGPTFSIDFENDRFLKDGRPFQYVSGSIHYVRVPPYYWLDRLHKMRAAGLNAIEVYVMWNVHEPRRGVYDFEGQNDLEQFLGLAHQVGLLVVLRPGPYVCAEWEYGGFPAWLLREHADVGVRTMNPRYLKPVDRWLGVLLPKMRRLLYVNGGPIIMVQVENEYGSFPVCDRDYMRHLRDRFRTLLRDDVVLFTTDGAAERYLKCGAVKGVYATVDFGPGNVTAGFEPMRKWTPKGPLVNSEFYTGWLDVWGRGHSHTAIATLVKTLAAILHTGASVNMYMFEGGTNFGYMNGADPGDLLVTTSYDYDAPLSEAGDITPKYLAIRDLLSKYRQKPLSPVPPSTPKYAYGKVKMRFVETVLGAVERSHDQAVQSRYPLSMEQVGQSYGFILYRRVLKRDVNCVLQIPGVRDSGYVYVNDDVVGFLDRKAQQSLHLVASKGSILSVLVENQGRTNFGAAIRDNRKGIISNVTLCNKTLTEWEIYQLNFTRLFSERKRIAREMAPRGLFRPGAYVGRFVLPDLPGFPQDTYLEMTGWTKGQAFINGFNVGRYWPVLRPQVTLFVPAGVLLPAPRPNTLLMVELRGAPHPQGGVVQFVAAPLFNTTREISWSHHAQTDT